MAGTAWNPGAQVLDGIAICAPWLAAAVLMMALRGQARIVGFMASLVSVAASALLLLAAPQGESLYEALMLLFSSLTAGMTLVLPKRDCDSRAIAGILFLLGATLLAYSSENLVVFLMGWVLSAIPFFPESWFRARSWRPVTSLLLSSIALAVAIGIIYYSGHAFISSSITTALTRQRPSGTGWPGGHGSMCTSRQRTAHG